MTMLLLVVGLNWQIFTIILNYCQKKNSWFSPELSKLCFIRYDSEKHHWTSASTERHSACIVIFSLVHTLLHQLAPTWIRHFNITFRMQSTMSRHWTATQGIILAYRSPMRPPPQQLRAFGTLSVLLDFGLLQSPDNQDGLDPKLMFTKWQAIAILKTPGSVYLSSASCTRCCVWCSLQRTSCESLPMDAQILICL